MLANFGKELPEDCELDELLDPEIPGLSPQGERSFDFVESEVRAQLGHLPQDMTRDIFHILRGYEPTVFETRTMPRMAPHRDLDLAIDETPGSRPVASRPYPVAPQHLPELARQIDVLARAGIIRRSTSYYASPVLFAPKKDGKLRLCIDYRRLNAQTLRDPFPTPVAADLIAQTRGMKMFSKLDLQSGFHQMRIREGDQHKTAFCTPGGLYEWVTCPFGLSNTPGCFQRLMNHVLYEHIAAGYCICYCDDLLICTSSDDPREHLAKLTAVLDSLREHDLLVKGSKTELFRREVEFLGFHVSGDGWAPTESKIAAVVEWPAPETVKQLRSFLGMANFFRSFIPCFSEMVAPLTDLLKDSGPQARTIRWSVECETAFNLLKTTLTSAPVLRHFDPNLRTAIHIDGSQNAVGAVLLQWHPGETQPRPVAFMSRKLSGAQYRYDARNVEALAAQMALVTWRTLLLGIPFEIYSDHDSLQYLFTQKAPSQRILRLCEFLADFNFKEIKYVPGMDAAVPDFLSRPWVSARSNTCLHTLQQTSALSVVVLPACKGRVGVQGRDGASGLWSATRRGQETSRCTAQRALLPMCISGADNPTMTCVGKTGGVEMWRADFKFPVQPAAVDSGTQWTWMVPASLPNRHFWHRAHFELLNHFGVWCGQGHGSLFNSEDGPTLRPPPLLSVLQTTASSSTLMSDIQKGILDDFFFGSLHKSVTSSDNNFFRDFFLDTNKILCYQRAEDVRARVCVPVNCREAVLRAAHGDSLLAGHPGVDRTFAAVSHNYYWTGLHADVAHFVRSCTVCAAAKSSNQLRMGAESFSSIPLQPFTSWAMDLIGPLPVTKGGNEWIVTWVDRTSKTIVAAAALESGTSAKDLALLTFTNICCRFGLPVNLTMDNDPRFTSDLWKCLWVLCGTRLRFTSSYNPQSDPAERANRQVLEALRAAVATVVQYDEWDLALPHITFGLNNHVSAATQVSPFEFAHGFPARVPLTLGVSDTTEDGPVDQDALDLAQTVMNRHKAASDAMAAAQVKLGQLLEKRSTPSVVKVSDKVWLDSKHVPVDVPYKLTSRWFGPFDVLEAAGAQVTLDLPATFGRQHRKVNIRRLKFFEERDDRFGDGGGPPTPLLGNGGATKDEVRRISNSRTHKGQHELWVEWQGYDQSQNCWVHRDVLMADVPAMVRAYDLNPAIFKARVSAPKRATRGYKSPVVVPPGIAHRMVVAPVRAGLRPRGI